MIYHELTVNFKEVYINNKMSDKIRKVIGYILDKTIRLEELEFRLYFYIDSESHWSLIYSGLRKLNKKVVTNSIRKKGKISKCLDFN